MLRFGRLLGNCTGWKLNYCRLWSYYQLPELQKLILLRFLLASQPGIEVTQVCLDFAAMTLCRSTHFGEHVWVEVEHQPDGRIDCGVFLETLS